MASIPSPFVTKIQTVAAIEAESNENSLRCLLQIYKRSSKTLTTLEKVAPESSLHLSWKGKVENARVDYLETAQRLGKGDAEARAALIEETI